ncbi:MAG: GNAT family N-acetyltransferase [Roseibium sp.]|nr:GNAT family N-acetyltransferase [Roseibium sp.]
MQGYISGVLDGDRRGLLAAGQYPIAWEDHVQTIFLECRSVQLVPLSPTDINLVKDLHSDPYGNRCSEYSTNCTIADAAALVRAALKNQADLGFAKWKAVSEDGKFLGWAGFTPVSETSEISLNYCLLKDVLEEDKNLAKSLCAELANWFFKNTYFSHLVAVVRTDNRDMRDVVQQAGFYHRESKVIGGMQADVFQLLSPSMQSYLMSA